MLRNEFGSFNVAQSIGIIIELFALGAFGLQVAVRLFRYGSISYTSKVSLETAFQRQR